jgi:probable phosphoglycerate mutase
MDIILIRHGQSVANEKKLLISNELDGLTGLGEKQSREIAEAFVQEGYSPDLIYCSPWKRAVETANIIFPNQVKDIISDNRLAETHPGVYETWLEEDFNRAYPEFHQDITNKYEGGESHLDMANRVCEWVDTEIMPKANINGLLVAVAHGGPISVILQYLLSIPIKTHYPSFSVPNASYTRLIWRNDKNRYCLITAGKS